MELKKPENMESMSTIMDAVIKTTAHVFGKTVGVALIIYDDDLSKNPRLEYYSNIQNEVLIHVLSITTKAVAIETESMLTQGNC